MDSGIQELTNQFGKYCAANPLVNIPNCAFASETEPTECAECVLGHGLNDDNECKKCQEVSDGCRKCSLGEYARCEDCKIGYGLQYDTSLYEYKCISCGTLSADCKFCRMGSTGEALECLETSSCTPHCMSCTPSECTSWHDGYFRTPESPLNVAPCVGNCLDCNNGASCLSCKGGYTVSEDSASCVSCSSVDPECSMCKYEMGELICTSCWGEMTLKPNVKYSWLEDICSLPTCMDYLKCALCSYAQCLQCENDHYLDTSGVISTCKLCDSKYTDCGKCDPTECTECKQGSAEYWVLGLLNCKVCDQTIKNCTACEYLEVSGLLNCTTCGSGYNSVTAAGYDYCRNSAATKSGCVDSTLDGPTEYCNLCAYGFVDQHNSGDCETCSSKIAQCLECSLSTNPGPSLLLCDACAPGFAPNTAMTFCIQQDCEQENCEECEPAGGCKICLPGYMKDEDNECESCSELTYEGCEGCKSEGESYICTRCSSGYGEQKVAPEAEEAQCIKCEDLSSGCQDCLVDPTGSITTCSVCQSGYTASGTSICLKCSDVQSECQQCEIIGEGFTPNSCKICNDGYAITASGPLSYCRAANCNVLNCISCEGARCTKCFGTTVLTPDNTECYDAGRCSEFSLTIDNVPKWKLDECYACPPDKVFDGINCIDCHVDHCISTACKKMGPTSYCGLCEENYIPQSPLADFINNPNPSNYPYYLGTSCVWKANCNYRYSTQFTDICIQGIYMIIIYIYIYIL